MCTKYKNEVNLFGIEFFEYYIHVFSKWHLYVRTSKISNKSRTKKYEMNSQNLTLRRRLHFSELEFYLCGYGRTESDPHPYLLHFFIESTEHCNRCS